MRKRWKSEYRTPFKTLSRMSEEEWELVEYRIERGIRARLFTLFGIIITVLSIAGKIWLDMSIKAGIEEKTREEVNHLANLSDSLSINYLQKRIDFEIISILNSEIIKSSVFVTQQYNEEIKSELSNFQVESESDKIFKEFFDKKFDKYDLIFGLDPEYLGFRLFGRDSTTINSFKNYCEKKEIEYTYYFLQNLVGLHHKVELRRELEKQFKTVDWTEKYYYEKRISDLQKFYSKQNMGDLFSDLKKQDLSAILEYGRVKGIKYDYYLYD